jgi:hypothetical protein
MSTCPAKLTTNHHRPWALVRRGGDTIGKRPSTRMAFLVGTIAPEGTAIALTGHVMNNDMTGWSKSRRRIEWADIVKQWRHQPSVADVKKAKLELPRVTADTPLPAGHCYRAYYERTGQIPPLPLTVGRTEEVVS